MYFSSDSTEEQGFPFIFGCVQKETNLFYTQEANGILGMANVHRRGVSGQSPIY